MRESHAKCVRLGRSEDVLTPTIGRKSQSNMMITSATFTC